MKAYMAILYEFELLVALFEISRNHLQATKLFRTLLTDA